MSPHWKKTIRVNDWTKDTIVSREEAVRRIMEWNRLHNNRYSTDKIGDMLESGWFMLEFSDYSVMFQVLDDVQN